jgi:tetratricopeptide (TPR) repeat protein
MLTLQNEIVAAITREVRLQLTPEEQVRLARARPVNPQAYEAYLRGMFYLNQATPEGTERGLALLHEAVERDPANPLPHAHLALGYATLGHGPSPTPDAFVRARAAALRALELDEGIAQAHQVLGELTMYADRQWDWAAAERSLSRARELNPALAPSHAHYAWYVVLFDRWEEGFASMRRAQEVDPLAPLWPAWQGSLYWWVGRYDEAIRECQKSLELNPSFPTALSILGRAYSDKGMHDEAIAAQEKAVALNRSYLWGLGYAYARAGRRADALRIATEYKGTTGDGYQSATIHAALGDTEGALRALQEASERGEISPWIRNLRVFAPLRDDPRFQDLARSMKVPV